MSFISLGKISTNWSTTEDKFYVAGLINSDSGLLSPKIIRDKRYIETYYGDFEYSKQYKDYIDNDIPVVLIPIITPESYYNRPSLRLNRRTNIVDGSNDNNIIYCHPKLDKTYESVTLGSVVEVEIKGEIGWVDIETRSNLKFYPLVSVIENDNVIKTPIRYKTLDNESNTIIISVWIPDDKQTYKLIYESIPEVDEEISDNSRIRIIRSLGIEDKYLVPRYREDDFMPEVVGTYRDSDGYDYYVDLDKSQSNSGTEVTINNGIDPVINRLDVRYIPNSYLDIVTLTDLGISFIDHKEPKYRVVKFEANGKKFTAECTYLNDVNFVLTIKDELSTDGLSEGKWKCIYNVIRMTADTLSGANLSSLLNDVTAFNTILDFSNSKQFISKCFRTDTPIKNFILLSTIRGNILFSTLETEVDLYMSSSNYTQFKPIEDVSKFDNKFLAFIQSFCHAYESFYENSSKILFQLIIEFLSSSLKDYCNRQDYTLEVTNWLSSKSEITNWLTKEVYIYDFWLATNAVVNEVALTNDNSILDLFLAEFNLVKEEYTKSDILNFCSRLDNLTQDQVFEYVETWQLDEITYDKVFIRYAEPTLEPNYYVFDNLKLSNSFGYTNDVLSQITENYKICEFYSKAKGPASKSIQIKVKKNQYFEGLYDINISSQDLTESYLVYIGNKKANYPTNSIFIDDINYQSELVMVRLFNYFYSGRLVDPQFYEFPINHVIKLNDYPGDSYEGFVPENLLTLPEGEWNLNRIVEEDYRTDDLVTTLTDFSWSRLYPDLLLIDRIPKLIYEDKSKLEFNEFLDLFYSLSYGSQSIDSDGKLKLIPGINNIYTQTLINLHKEDIFMDMKESPYVSEQNRLMYFIGDLWISDSRYSSLFPYVIDIVKSSYLDDISERLIYSPFDLSSENIVFRIPVKYSEITKEALPPEFDKITNSNAEILQIESTYKEYIYFKEYPEDYFKLDRDSYPMVLLNPEVIDEFTGESVKWYLFTSLDYSMIYKFNYLQYNNLRYFYKTLYEPENQQSIFVIRFLTSKISREIFKNQGLLKGSSQSDIVNKLNKILGNFQRFSDLYKSVNYSYVINGNQMNLSVEANIKSLINIDLSLNFVLNIKS